MTTMRNPLTDLPLDKFVSYEHRTSTKRPLSPGAVLLSPSKRRLLSAEGIYSPQKKRPSTPSKQLFSDLVVSPPSPARRLDFSALSHPSPRKASAKRGRDASPRPETPLSRTGTLSKLAPSPEIASSSSSDASTRLNNNSNVALEPSRALPLPPPMIIPREMPTFADRQSIHHPGFDVHADTHISIPTSYSTSLTTPHTSDTMDESDVDDSKENIRPRKRAGKRAASDDAKSVKPLKLGQMEKHAHEEGINIMAMLTPSPGKRAMTPQEKQQGRKQMRLIMELEMDEEDDVEDQL